MLKNSKKVNEDVENDENASIIKSPAAPLDFCNMEINNINGKMKRDSKATPKIRHKKTNNR